MLFRVVSMLAQAQFGLREQATLSLSDEGLSVPAAHAKARGDCGEGRIQMAINTGPTLQAQQPRPTLYDAWTSRDRGTVNFFLAGAGMIQDTPYM